MKSIPLRFKRKRWLVAAGLLIALAITPFAQSGSAAQSVSLELVQDVRRAAGPNAPSNYFSSLNVQSGNTAQVRAFIHNNELAESGRVAEGITYLGKVPKGPATSAGVVGSIAATNSVNQPVVTNTLNSANGQAFSLGKPTNFKVAKSTLSPQQCNQPIRQFGTPQSVPSNDLAVVDGGDHWQIYVDPTGDSRLDPCFCEAVELTFEIPVTSVQPSPTPTPKVTPTPTPTPKVTPTPTPTPKVTPTPTPKVTPTPTPKVTPSPKPSPLGSPSPIPSPVPSPTVSPTPDDCPDTPTPMPSASPRPEVSPVLVSPLPQCQASPTPSNPPGGGGNPPGDDKGAPGPDSLPKTGAAQAAAIAFFALMASTYLYLRERHALKAAVREYKVKR